MKANSQIIPENPAKIGIIQNFSGIFDFSGQYDGQWDITVKQVNGKLLRLYVSTIQEDKYAVDFNSVIRSELSGNYDRLIGKKVKGICVSAYGVFENYETGINKKKIIWRPKTMELVK
jgi:hypothetical protein